MALVPAVTTLLTVLLVFHVGASWYGEPRYRWLGYFAIVGHAIAGAIALYVLPYTWDVGTFHEAGVAVLSGEPVRESTTVSAFAAVQGLIYAIFGAHPIVVSMSTASWPLWSPFSHSLSLAGCIPASASERSSSRRSCSARYPSCTSRCQCVMP
jgi:hypothetical protein